MNRTAIVVALMGCLAACKNTSEEAAPVGAAHAAITEPTSHRRALVTYRPLLDEVGRAELDANGLLIDLGVPDQHKYTRGGWKTGWGDSGADEHTAWGTMTARRALLDLVAPRSAPSALVMRARSRGDQQLTWFVNGRELGTVKLGTAWQTLRVPVPAGAVPPRGRIRLEARASSPAVRGVRAELDWIWLAAGPGEPAMEPRMAPIEIAGRTRRALAARTPRSYGFYLAVPSGSELVVDLGAADQAEFVITAVTDDGKQHELLRETVTKSWKERAVSLDALAGRAIRLELNTSSQRGLAGWGEPEIMRPRSSRSEPSPTGAPPRNVILLVMDTARADAFGPFAGPDRVAKTPRFDALAANSTAFVAAYDNENWTKPSVATTLTGLYPSTHGTKEDASKLSGQVELVSERLKREGFATAGFVANGYISGVFGFEQGWDTFKNYIREGKPSEAEHVFSDALAWQAEHAKSHPDQPFFLYLQTIDPHVTYRVDREFSSPYFPEDYDGPLGRSIEAEEQVALSTRKLAASERDQKWLRALYWGEIAYHDAQLAKFLAELETRGVLTDTMLVVTNDHGEELGERGRYGHGHQVFEEMIRAPLIVHYPPMFAPGAVIRDIVEHVDLAPTILDVLGKQPLEDADGISLLPLVRGQSTSQPHYAVSEFLHGQRVVRVGSWKLVAKPEGATLFDLAHDRGETEPLGDDAVITRQLCEVHLGEALAIPRKARRMTGIATRRKFRAGEADISPRMRRQLEALGYFGSAPKSGSAKDDDVSTPR